MIYWILVAIAMPALLVLTEAGRRCQPNDVYYPPTGKCYALNRQGPCNALMIMTASTEDGSGDGYCTCKPSKCSLDRKLGYWDSTQRCYYAFDEGPCPKGEWLVPNADSSQYLCERIPCPELYSRQEAPPEKDPAIEASNTFVFAYNGTCYTQGTQEHCPEEEKLWLNPESGEPYCSSVGSFCLFGFSVTGNLECSDGSARDMGACSPLADTLDYE